MNYNNTNTIATYSLICDKSEAPQHSVAFIIKFNIIVLCCKNAQHKQDLQ